MASGMDVLAIKGGAIIAGGSIATELIILNDPLYWYLAIAGAFVSMLGVVHEVYSKPEMDDIRAGFIIVESMKGLFLGLVATPMWFMGLMQAGGAIVEHFVGIKDFQGVSNSFWFLLSLMLAWWTIPIMTWIIEKVKSRGKEKSDG